MQDKDTEEPKPKTFKAEAENRDAFNLENAIRLACDSVIRGELKWVPPLYLECEQDDMVFRTSISHYLDIHRKNECERQKCGCDILRGLVYCQGTGCSVKFVDYIMEMKNPVAFEMFDAPEMHDLKSTSGLVRDPLAFLKKYRFMTWYTKRKVQLDYISAKDAGTLIEDFKYNPFFYGDMASLCYRKVSRLDPMIHHVSETREALSRDLDALLFGELSDFTIPDQIREKIERDGNNSFKAISRREERRKAVKSLILCARKFSQDSPFYEDELPLDMLKIIVTLAELKSPQWFY